MVVIRWGVGPVYGIMRHILLVGFLATPALGGDGDALVHEGVIEASVAEVWAALTTKEGIQSWMVPLAEIDLRVGGKMRTNYHADGTIGDPNTIENTILSFEPNRMLSIKATKPPEGFPFPKTIENTWSVIYFEPVSADQTRIRIAGMGYGDDEESVKMRAFFEAGNAWTLEQLRKKFAKATETDSTSPKTIAPTFQSYLAHVAAADASMRLNESAAAQRWLEGAPPALRGWEWKRLSAMADESLSVIEAHEKGVQCVAVSPDASRFATAGRDGLVKIWSLEGKGAPLVLTGHDATVYNVSFSPDGSRLASASHDKTVRVWDVRTGDNLMTFKRHNNPVAAAAFTPDGRTLASCSYERMPTCVEGTVHVWDASTGEVKKTLKAGVKPLSSILYSRDGKRLAAGSWDAEVYVWDVESGGDPVVLTVPDERIYRAVDAVAFSPDATLVAAATKGNVAVVWDVKTATLVATLRGHGALVTTVAFSHDGKTLATGGHDDLVRLWDVAAWKEKTVLRGHEQAINGTAWAPGDAILLTASTDGTVRQWDPQYPHYGGMRLQNGESAYASHFSPDGRLLASCGFDGTVQLWDARSGESLGLWKAHEKSCNTISFSGDGTKLASCSYDKLAKIWDVQTRKEIAALEHEGGVYHCAFSPDNVHVATAVMNAPEAWIWDATAAKHTLTLTGHESKVSSVAYNRDGSMIATSSADKTVRTWDAADGTLVAVMKGHDGALETVAFSPDGAMVASGGQDGSVRLWNSRSGELVRVLFDGDEAIHRVAFTPDGSRVAIATRAVTLVDTATGEAVAQFTPHKDAIWHLAFSPDGTRLATSSWDGSIVISDTTPLRDRILNSQRR